MPHVHSTKVISYSVLSTLSILIATCHVKPGQSISSVASGRHTQILFDVLNKVPSMDGEQGEAEWGGQGLEEEGGITDLRAV